LLQGVYSAQTFPHAPQLFRSLKGSTQVPEQRTIPSGQPEGLAAFTHALLMHTLPPQQSASAVQAAAEHPPPVVCWHVPLTHVSAPQQSSVSKQAPSTLVQSPPALTQTPLRKSHTSPPQQVASLVHALPRWQGPP
jgi:hypothetical protein